MSDITHGRRQPKILVVDDEETNRRLFETLLRGHDYEVRCAVDGVDALQIVGEFQPDLILLDVMMPRMTGFDAARELKRAPDTRHIPIVMLTALDDRASRMQALAAGAEEFLTKPVDHSEVLVRLRNLLRAKTYGDLLSQQNRLLEQRVRERSAQLRDSHRETVHAIMSAIEYRDETTGPHVRRIGRYAAVLARQLGLGEEYADTIFFAGPMHDIGKVGVPSTILLKHGELTEAEREIMKSHTLLGERLLHESQSPYLRMGAEIAAGHHEHWDGSGYPRNLRGDAIPLAARIMLLCDRYDALRSRRPYKEEMEHETAVQILREGDGRSAPTHFDPAVLAAFVKVHGTFEDIYRHIDTGRSDQPVM